MNRQEIMVEFLKQIPGLLSYTKREFLEFCHKAYIFSSIIEEEAFLKEEPEKEGSDVEVAIVYNEEG